jgi:uncharacterized protein YbjT (DUF2867 family)
MRIVVIGGSGLIGTRVVDLLRGGGHEVVAASPSLGIDAITGVGLSEALAGAEVVVDVAEARSFEEGAARDFFVVLTRNLLRAEATARVGHHVALSVVGVDRIRDSGYFCAKAAQEELIMASSIPYSIVRSTQFFGLMEQVLEAGSDGADTVRLPSTLIEPVAPDDVAELVAEVAEGPPLNGIVELAGPETICLHELARLILSAHEDPRSVIADPDARFFGAALNGFSLLPGPDRRIGPSTLRDWLRHFMTAD